jgi:RimJ/RimL family protein N-acetyltransferase
MFIRSERLFLRPGWPEDWKEVLERIADEAVVMNLATAPWPYTGADARAFLDRPRERLLPQFLITLPGSHGTRLIGAIGLAREDRDADLGYWIARDHWGQGFATEAVSAVLRLASALGHRRVVAYHFADNPASGRVLVKAGFRPTGCTSMRHSLGRGRKAPAVDYAAELGEPNDCDAEAMKMVAA